MKLFFSFPLSWLFKLCFLGLFFVGCSGDKATEGTSPVVEETQDSGSLSAESPQALGDNQDASPVLVENIPENTIGAGDGDSSLSPKAQPDAPVLLATATSNEEDSSLQISSFPASELKISKSQAGHSVWEIRAPSLNWNNIGTAFAIGPNQFISSFHLFDYMIIKKVTLDQLTLFNQKGEKLSLKRIVKVDPASDFVLFESQSSVSDYIDLRLYLALEDQALSSTAKMSMISYTQEGLTEIKQTEGTVIQDNNFYVYPVSISQWDGLISSPIFKDGKLVAVQSGLSSHNLNIATKAQHLQGLINEAFDKEQRVVDCSQVEMISCIEKGLDHLREMYIQNQNPLFFHALDRLKYTGLEEDELFEEFINSIKASTNSKVTRNLLADKFAHLLREQPDIKRERIIAWFELAANNGYAPSQHSLGLIYLQDEEKDLKLVVEWFKKSSDQGYAPAQYRLGTMYVAGHYVAKDLKMAKNLYRRSANNGDPLAQHDLGVMYFEGVEGVVEENHEEAFDLFEKAALQGIELSQYLMGIKHLELQEFEEAFGWLKRSAKQRFPPAYFQLGRMYFNEWLTNEDRSVVEDSLIQAYVYFSLAEHAGGFKEEESSTIYSSIDEILDSISEDDLAIAQYRIGLKYLEGDEVAVNLVEARHYFEVSSYQDYAPPKIRLGDMYFNGIGVEQNYEKAFNQYEEPANEGYAKAQNLLGFMYLHGLHVEQDYEKAFKWIKEAAEQGHPEAQYNLAYMYVEGLYVLKDEKEALRWLEKSEAQGFRVAPDLMGQIYLNGSDSVRDLEKAVESFKRSADQGYAPAQAKMGNFYWEGVKDGEKVILEPDRDSAYYYMNLAKYNGIKFIVLGEEDPIDIEDHIENTMPMEDLTIVNHRLRQAGY